MKIRLKIFPTVCYAAFLSACALNQSSDFYSLKITPTVNKSSSDNPNTFYQMGRYYQGQNRYDQAIEAYKKTLIIDSGYVEAMNGLGVIYARQKKFSDAISVFKTAIKLTPNAAHILNNLGYAYYLQGQYGESIQALEQSVAINPNDESALNNLGLAYAKAGNSIDAKQAFSKALSLINPSQPLIVSEADSLSMSAQAVNSTTLVNVPKNQSLSLPKNIGIIKSASAIIPVSASSLEKSSSVTLVKVSPYIYELHPKLTSTSQMPMKNAQDVVAQFKVEVSNGNGVNGMARKVGKFLNGLGYSASRLTNQKPYQAISSVIQYREGYQIEAQRIQMDFPQSIELVQRKDLRADVSIRILLGKDIATHTAYFNDR